MADLSDSLRLCLAEALNNVVEHAYSGDHSRRIDVSLKLGNGGYRVTVCDTGAPMPGGILPEREADVDVDDIQDLPEGGFGWMLIRSEVDHLDYERRGERNILVLDKTNDA
jgi:serine/threonine-protein kinase RsbW